VLLIRKSVFQIGYHLLLARFGKREERFFDSSTGPRGEDNSGSEVIIYRT